MARVSTDSYKACCSAGDAENAGVVNAGVENAGADRKGGKCRSDNAWKSVRKDATRYQ